MANTRTIQYTTHKGGNTVYSDITMSDKIPLLKMLNNGLFEMIEAANYDDTTRTFMFEQNKNFNKHLASGNRTTNNCCASFLSGLLKQHNGNTGKDISVKMLPGIAFATEVLNHLNPKYTIYTFDEVEVAVGNSVRPAPTTFETLFGKEV